MHSISFSCANEFVLLIRFRLYHSISFIDVQDYTLTILKLNVCLFLWRPTHDENEWLVDQFWWLSEIEWVLWPNQWNLIIFFGRSSWRDQIVWTGVKMNGIVFNLSFSADPLKWKECFWTQNRPCVVWFDTIIRVLSPYYLMSDDSTIVVCNCYYAFVVSIL